MKWKLDAQLYSLLARYVCDLHALHDLWPRCDAKVRRRGATPRCDANFTLLFYSLSEFILNPGESMESMESIERLFYSLSEFILNPGLSMEDIECAISGIDPV